MADRLTADEVRAAGAVVRRSAGSGSRVLLVHRPKYDDWSFPKGKLEPGEHALLAAVREVAEETALQVTLGRRLRPVHYDNGGVPKRVDYWVASVPGEPADFEPNCEVDETAWLPASQAAARLSYERDLETLAEFMAGPRQTVPLILVRHASAGNKSGWPGSDVSRPLDNRGTEDARALANLLRCFGAGRVVSGPAERCVATVRPYAASIGGVIEIEPAFEVGGGVSEPDGAASAAAGVSAGAAASAGAGASAAVAAVARLAADSRPVVVCAHRENLPALLAAACAALGAPSPRGKPLRKSEFAVLHRSAGKLAALERYRPDGDSLGTGDRSGGAISELAALAGPPVLAGLRALAGPLVGG
jgi:8-oxo-dGTP pyrophosphatase MutT (NUDIX family)